MSQNDDDKLQARRAETFEMAVALSDDLKHIRGILGREEIGRGDARRMSAQLRRILVDGDLVQIAGPRLGRIKINSPQLREYHHVNEQSPLEIFTGGNLEFATMAVGNMAIARQRIGPTKGHPDDTIDLNVDQFCKQRVICFRGHWITRQQVIQYIANKASGVHSDKPSEPTHQRLDELRGYAGIRMNGGFATIEANIQATAETPEPWEFDKHRLDFGLIQLLSTAQYLERSPQVRKLEAAIDDEGKSDRG